MTDLWPLHVLCLGSQVNTTDNDSTLYIRRHQKCIVALDSQAADIGARGIDSASLNHETLYTRQ